MPPSLKLWVFAALLAAASRPGAAANDYVDHYRSWLDQEERLLRQAEASCKNSKGASLGPLDEAKALANQPGYGIDPTETDWLARECGRLPDAKPADRPALLGSILARVDAYQEAVAMETRQPKVNPVEARTALSRILNKPEFAWQSHRPSQWEKLKNRFIDWWWRLFYSAARVANWALIALTVAIAGVLLFLAFMALRGRPRSDQAALAKEGTAPEGWRPRKKDDLYRQAEEASRAGRFREALRLLYVAFLRDLDKVGAIRLIKHKTNWDYRREIEAQNPGLGNIFGPFTDLYEVKWYGREECTAEHYAVARRLYEEARGVAR